MENNTLLVIGNGFDLTVGAKTSYNDFFNSEYYTNTYKVIYEIKKAFEKYQQIPKEYMSNKDINCWDLLFFLESYYDQDASNNNAIRWCDVERIIYNSMMTSLLDARKNIVLWKRVFNLVKACYNDALGNLHFVSSDGEKIRIMTQYIRNTCNISAMNNENKFYEWLLEELIRFEGSFGQYILEETREEAYAIKAKEFAKEIAGGKDNVQIDSFNYSDFQCKQIDIRHINGDNNNPIFGIDISPEKEKSNPEVIRFTKTARRIKQDVHNLNRGSAWRADSINHAIIYGHSLDEMDYDYFNYLFTLLQFNTFEIDRMGSIEFLYRVYDESKKDEIRNHHADAVYKLLNYYEEYVSRSNQHILINLLRFSGKLKIRELS